MPVQMPSRFSANAGAMAEPKPTASQRMCLTVMGPPVSTPRPPREKSAERQTYRREHAPDQPGLLEIDLLADRIVAAAELVEAIAPKPVAIIPGESEHDCSHQGQDR